MIIVSKNLNTSKQWRSESKQQQSPDTTNTQFYSTYSGEFPDYAMQSIIS